MSYERHAYWCQHRSHEADSVPLRVFINAGDPVPTCPITGHGKMKRQNNNPYFGKPVEDGPLPEPPEPEAAAA